MQIHPFLYAARRPKHMLNMENNEATINICIYLTFKSAAVYIQYIGCIAPKRSCCCKKNKINYEYFRCRV
ncbi:hypothetical protein [Mythimna sequax nucleopolyhedrovirus]|nr:hypothetical protein [Mythimna sequax nucleopolyhedrovirus]